MSDATQAATVDRECGLFGIGIGEPQPHDAHEWTDGDGGWFACSGHQTRPARQGESRA